VVEDDMLKPDYQIRINVGTQRLKDLGVGGFGTKIDGIKDTV
jgi:hypothetical protein